MCQYLRQLTVAAAVLVLSAYSVKVAVTPKDVDTVTFLLTVHAPWNACFASVETPAILPNKDWHTGKHVDVDGCDSGPLTFVIRNNSSPYYYPCTCSSMVVDVTFYSADVHAMPPTCSICWNGTYLTPHTMWANESLLPGCETSDSVEGYHTTYYWFHILSWRTK
ncbi:uncharacterized protein LOC124257133 [Haliotis rubra]|uniref:uncharacterized protein LOC124257133 n=1 Tax=Haliotis rubra TaxID=36100 RepID=UPI001EE56F4B|nr:uncharacterized protein LOC124257133 [Haliotis rubra]